MLDKFARQQGIPFPGGPVIEKLAKAYIDENPNATLDELELPYPVRGMDLAFSGILTGCTAPHRKGTFVGRRMLVTTRACLRCMHRSSRACTCA